jgi:hypothetical protein
VSEGVRHPVAAAASVENPVASGSAKRTAMTVESEDDPAESCERIITEAMQRSEDLLEMADMPPKACHCTCSLAPDGRGCLTQFTAAEIDQIRYVRSVSSVK